MFLMGLVFPFDSFYLELELLDLPVLFLDDILQVDNFSNGAVIPFVTFVVLYGFLKSLYHLICVLQLVAAVIY